jgi:hypothetical protein
MPTASSTLAIAQPEGLRYLWNLSVVELRQIVRYMCTFPPVSYNVLFERLVSRVHLPLVLLLKPPNPPCVTVFVIIIIIFSC